MSKEKKPERIKYSAILCLYPNNLNIFISIRIQIYSYHNTSRPIRNIQRRKYVSVGNPRYVYADLTTAVTEFENVAFDVTLCYFSY